MSEESWLVISNCQARGLAHSMQSQLHETNVSSADFSEVRSNPDEWRDRIAGAHRVFMSEEALELVPPEVHAGKAIIEIPSITSRIFHPDCVEVMNGKSLVRSGAGMNHSLIAFAGYVSGLDVEQTLRLFNGGMYAELGYYRSMADEKTRLAKRISDRGFNIRPFIKNWGRTGAFMHTNNHPTINVLYDLATAILAEQDAFHSRDGFIPADNLKFSSAFPVYPEVAQHLGVEGGTNFRNGGSYKPVALQKFVEISFANYDNVTREDLRINPIFAPELDAALQIINRIGNSSKS